MHGAFASHPPDGSPFEAGGPAPVPAMFANRVETARLGIRLGLLSLAMLFLGLIGAFALEPSLLAIALGVVLLCLIAIVNSDGWCAELVEWTIQWIKFVLGGWGRIVLDNRIAAAWMRRRRGSTHSRHSAGRWVVPLVLGGMPCAD